MLYTCSPVQELPHSISQGSETCLAGAVTHRDWHRLTPWTQGWENCGGADQAPLSPELAFLTYL